MTRTPVLHAGHCSGLYPRSLSKAATQFASFSRLGADGAPISFRQRARSSRFLAARIP